MSMPDKLRDTLWILMNVNGFTLVSRKGHIRIRHPSGKVFTCSSSPRAQHAHKELLRDIRRYENGTYR